MNPRSVQVQYGDSEPYKIKSTPISKHWHEFCIQVKEQGTYKVNPVAVHEERKYNVMNWDPAQMEVNIDFNNYPSSFMSANFTQSKYTVSGKLNCYTPNDCL